MPNPISPIILIPAHNEQASVGEVVTQIRRLWNYPVVVIDDCSSDATIAVARAAGATVLPLTIQLGAWGAMQTGLRYAVRAGYQIAITMDADGQHEPAGIGALLDPLMCGASDVCIGAFPQRASAARRFAWRYFRWLTGLKPEDITSGFRAYNQAAMAVLVSSEASLIDYQDVGVLLILCRKKLRIIEVPVSMQARSVGPSKIFHSWWVVGKYMLQTTLLCIARVGHNHLRRVHEVSRDD